MLKQACVAISLLSVVCSVAAADIASPFYLPVKGQIGSITSVDYTRNHYKDRFSNTAKTYNTNLSEKLEYGLTDNFTVVVSGGNIFAKLKEALFGWNPGTKTKTEDKNINWEAGFAWKILDKALKLQTSLVYGQDPSVNRFNHDCGEYKYVTGTIRTGYQLKTMLPYVELSEQFPIGQKERNYYRVGSDMPIYNAKVGLFQGKCETWGLDTGIRYTHDENTDVEGTAYVVEAEASYYLEKNITVGLYGTYALKGRAKVEASVHNKTMGARLRWFF